MKLERVTITGIDQKTDLGRLGKLGLIFPLECAFLASPSRAGQDPRYPTMDDIGGWSHYLSTKGIPTAIHICGRYSRKPQEFFEALPQITRFDRIQWNVAPSHLKEKGIEEMILNQKGHGTVIVQIRDEESIELLKKVRDSGVRTQPLIDGSGGRGIPFERIEKPLDGPKTGKWTGYAGGISPENVEVVLRRLEYELMPTQPIWIDMETGVRDEEDWLDLDKVQEVLCKVFIFMQKQEPPKDLHGTSMKLRREHETWWECFKRWGHQLFQENSLKQSKSVNNPPPKKTKTQPTHEKYPLTKLILYHNPQRM